MKDAIKALLATGLALIARGPAETKLGRAPTAAEDEGMRLRMMTALEGATARCGAAGCRLAFDSGAIDTSVRLRHFCGAKA